MLLHVRRWRCGRRSENASVGANRSDNEHGSVLFSRARNPREKTNLEPRISRGTWIKQVFPVTPARRAPTRPQTGGFSSKLLLAIARPRLAIVCQTSDSANSRRFLRTLCRDETSSLSSQFVGLSVKPSGLGPKRPSTYPAVSCPIVPSRSALIRRSEPGEDLVANVSPLSVVWNCACKVSYSSVVSLSLRPASDARRLGSARPGSASPDLFKYLYSRPGAVVFAVYSPLRALFACLSDL